MEELLGGACDWLLLQTRYPYRLQLLYGGDMVPVGQADNGEIGAMMLQQLLKTWVGGDVRVSRGKAAQYSCAAIAYCKNRNFRSAFETLKPGFLAPRAQANNGGRIVVLCDHFPCSGMISECKMWQVAFFGKKGRFSPGQDSRLPRSQFFLSADTSKYVASVVAQIRS